VFRRDVGGMDYVRGRLDSEASATVQAALGALAQRIAAAAWTEDLAVRIMADFGPPSKLQVRAAESTVSVIA